MRFRPAVPAFLLVLLAPPLWDGSVAGACGCFSLPDPLRPVVQEGEQIVFVVGGGVVTAIVQIRYQGPGPRRW